MHLSRACGRDIVKGVGPARDLWGDQPRLWPSSGAPAASAALWLHLVLAQVRNAKYGTPSTFANLLGRTNVLGATLQKGDIWCLDAPASPAMV